MIQLRVRTNSNGVSWIKLPNFPAPIKDIKCSVTSASAKSEGADQTSSRLYYQATNAKDADYESFGGTATNEIVMDLSGFSYTTGYITANAGIRIWNITVTLQGEGGGETPVVTPLATPSVTATASGNTINVSWGAITGAKNYTVKCGTQSKDVTGTSTSFTGLAYSTKYNVTVVANPSDTSKNSASEAGTASATTDADPNAGGSGDATGTVTIAFSSVLSNSEKVESNTYTSNGVTIKFTKVNGSGSYYDGSVLRLYQGDLMTITGAGAMKQIVITTSGGKNGPFSVDTGSITVSNSTKHTWTGNATSVTFTADKQARFASIEITY